MPVQLATAPKTSTGSRTGFECRVYPRLTCDLPSICSPAAGLGSQETCWPATIRDISPGGANVNLKRRFEPGTGLAIELPGRAGTEPYTVLARVVHVRPKGDGSWLMGCQFVSELGDDEVRRLFAAPVGEERAGPKTVANVHWQLEIRPGAVFSYEVKRLACPAAWPLRTGRIVTLRGKSAAGWWALKVKVTACRAQDGVWTVACRLLTPPTPENLLAGLASWSSQPLPKA